MRKICVTAILVAGLAGVSACGGRGAPDPAPVAVAATQGTQNQQAAQDAQKAQAVQDTQNGQATQAPPNPQGPGELPDLAGIEANPPAASAEEQPVANEAQKKPPTVAKTQRWVKIFSGPSDKDITPPKSKLKGSKTVELNATEN